jgi:uncharacterized iron-regulated membrane protein
MRYPHLVSTLGLVLLFAGSSGLLWAGVDTVPVAELRTSDLRLTEQQDIDLEQAIVRVRRDIGGQVLDAHSREDEDRRVHVIKVLTPQGHIRLVPVDATTGELLIRD